MTATLLTALLALGAGDKDAPPKRSAVAPSLPAVTEAQEKEFDRVIDRFILADTGRLKGAEAKKAVKEFEALKPEAIPALIRGLNRAAMIEHSCPVTVIAKKLDRMLLGSDDQELLEYARDEIGAGIKKSRHLGLLKDLRVKCMLRKNALARLPKAPRLMSAAELVKAAGSERGPRLKAVLAELEGRRGKEVLDGLAVAARSADADARKLGRELLDKHLSRQPAAVVKDKLSDEQAEVRSAAARVAAAKHLALFDAVVDLLADEKADVREEAHKALVKLSGGEDFGPAKGASTADAVEAQAKWRAWWKKSGKR